MTTASYYGSPTPVAPTELDLDTTPRTPVHEGRCQHCAAEAVTPLCWPCTTMLRRQLCAVPWLLRRLHESAYGEAKVARKGGLRVSTGERLPSLPLNSRAADLRRDAARLCEWADQVAPLDAKPGDPEAAVYMLVHAPAAMGAHPWAPSALRWVLQWRDAAERAIDLPPDTQYAGPCQVLRHDLIDTGDEPIKTIPVRRCNTPLYVDAESPTVECHGCGSVWDVSTLQRQALDRVDETEPRTQADMFRLLKLIGREVPRSTFYRLMTKVEAHGYNADGLPTYTYRSVVDALDEYDLLAAERRAAGKPKRGRPRKAKAVDMPTVEAERAAAVDMPKVPVTSTGVDRHTECVDMPTVAAVALAAPDKARG